MTRVALYAGYSSDNQSVSSIDDQFRICRDQAMREKWKVAGTYKDAAISGTRRHPAATPNRSAHFRADSLPCDAFKTRWRRSVLNALPIQITLHVGNGESEMRSYVVPKRFNPKWRCSKLPNTDAIIL